MGWNRLQKPGSSTLGLNLQHSLCIFVLLHQSHTCGSAESPPAKETAPLSDVRNGCQKGRHSIHRGQKRAGEERRRLAGQFPLRLLMQMMHINFTLHLLHHQPQKNQLLGKANTSRQTQFTSTLPQDSLRSQKIYSAGLSAGFCENVKSALPINLPTSPISKRYTFCKTSPCWR